MTAVQIRRRLERVRGAIRDGDRVLAERLEAELHAEVLEWIAESGRGTTRIRAALALLSRRLWLE